MLEIINMLKPALRADCHIKNSSQAMRRSEFTDAIVAQEVTPC
jgi:hypothetical protein